MATDGLLARARADGRYLLGVGVHSAFTAALAERSGFDAVWLSSLELSARELLPDLNVITPTEVAGVVASIARTTSVPIVVDIDNGYGSDETALRAVRDISAAGACAVAIEDNEFPKRCSFYEGADRQLADVAVLARRIERLKRAGAGVEIIARTEALVAGLSAEEAVARVRTYVDAGADAIFVQTTARSLDAFFKVLVEVRDLAPTMVTPTAMPSVAAQDLNRAGADFIVYSNMIIRTILRAVTSALDRVRREERLTLGSDSLASLDELFDVTRVEDWLTGHDRALDLRDSPP